MLKITRITFMAILFRNTIANIYFGNLVVDHFWVKWAKSVSLPCYLTKGTRTLRLGILNCVRIAAGGERRIPYNLHKQRGCNLNLTKTHWEPPPPSMSCCCAILSFTSYVVSADREKATTGYQPLSRFRLWLLFLRCFLSSLSIDQARISKIENLYCVS